MKVYHLKSLKKDIHLHLRHSFNQDSSGIQIFTDESKLDQRIGSAFAVYQEGEEVSHFSFRLNDEATVYLAELNAIELAVDYSLEHNFAKVDIITDSRSVLQALSNPSSSCPLIWRLKNKLKNGNTDISLKWTRAHVGTLGNESADKHAKQATTKEEIDIFFKIPISFVKTLIHQEIKSD
ncbi:uncharacterized protein CDAR_83501 [Caerostris darwini]|uniref:RNase H type-1 domain-containing protein n=1 Tax=Caerostris darwini TaxID=1538125 RepID=A0AAV4NFR3_9ARAC|nr:uncharacterized protein CDAR_83501 [Caerostris darwini]